VFLLVGGFLVAICMERWKLHNRIALRIMLIFGTKPKFLLLGSSASPTHL
jgi:sodium-dependent dicarboxylate transporter 2/3/5